MVTSDVPAEGRAAHGGTDWLGIAGRTAVVAGAGGLGSATAESLTAQGVTVAVLDIDGDRLDRLGDRERLGPGSVVGVIADLASPEGCRAGVAAAIEAVGTPDIFVHAVGRNDRRPILDFGDDDWNRMIKLNLSSAFWLAQPVGRAMLGLGAGRMVFISSASGWLAHADHGPYAASKGGLNQLVRVLAREWGRHGITVNAVAPGYIETDLTRAHLDTGGHRAELVSLVPAGRLGVPGEVADAITFLASDRAAFVNGHILWVDGGRSLV